MTWPAAPAMRISPPTAMILLKLEMKRPIPVLSMTVTPERSKTNLRVPEAYWRSTRLTISSPSGPNISLPVRVTTTVPGPASR